jgi:ubiquinone/menaquinone biosynthesis C-methylase UbiE
VRHAPARRLAVDCATGSGQAAVALAEHFAAVLAVDASSSQLTRAQPHPRVYYAASLAERLPAPDGSADLVTAAQAAHWFDFERFHAECRRVLAPGGVVAVWTAKDVPVNEYGLILPDQPVMVGLGSSNPHADVSLWEGDHVAVVVAETEAFAARACGRGLGLRA